MVIGMIDLSNKTSVANFLKKYSYTLDNTMFQVIQSMNTALISGTEALDKFFNSKEFQKEINEQARTAIVLLALEACLSSKDKTVHALIDSILTEDGLSRQGKIKQVDQDAYSKIFDLIHSHKDTAALEIYCTALSETGVKVVVDKLKEADLKGFTDSQLIDYAITIGKLKESGVIEEKTASDLVQKFMTAVTKVPSSLKDKNDFYKHVLPLIPVDPIMDHPLIEMTIKNGNRKGGWKLIEDIVAFSPNWKADNTKALLHQLIVERTEQKAFSSLPGNTLGTVLGELKDTKLNVRVFNSMIGAREKFEGKAGVDLNEKANAGYDSAIYAIFTHKESALELYNTAKGDDKKLKTLLDYHEVVVDKKEYSIGYLIYNNLSPDEKVAFLTNEAVDPFQILKVKHIQVVINPKVTAKRGDFWSDKSDTNLIKCAAAIRISTLSDTEKNALIQRITKHVDHKHAAFFTTPVLLMPDFIDNLKAINNPNLNVKVFKALIARREEIAKAAESTFSRGWNGLTTTNPSEGDKTRKALCEATLLHILTNSATVEALYQDYKGNAKGKLEKLLGNEPVDGKSVAYYMYKGLKNSGQSQEFLGNKLVNPESILSSMPQSAKADYVEFLKDYTAAITDVTQYTKPYSDPNEANELAGPYKLTLKVDGQDIKVGSMLDLMLSVDDDNHTLFNEFAKQFVTKIPTEASSVIFNTELDKVSTSLQAINDAKLSHDLMTKLYSEILSTDRGVELAKGVVVTGDNLETGTYLLANCAVADRADIIAKLSPQVLKGVLENLRDNKYIDTKVKLEILAIALGIDKYKEAAIEVAAKMQILANFGDQDALNAFSLALIQYEPSQDVVKMLSEVDDKLAKSLIKTIAKYDNQEVYAIIRGVANKAPERVAGLTGAQVTVDKKAQVLLGFADSGNDVYNKVSKFLGEANETATSIDFTDPESIKNAFYINIASTEDLNSIINLLTTYAVTEAKTLDQVTKFFEAGAVVFTSGASGPKDPAARDRFVVGYFNKLFDVSQDLATELFNAKTKDIMTTAYNEYSASKTKGDDYKAVNSLLDTVFTLGVVNNQPNEELIQKINLNLADVPNDQKSQFITYLIEHRYKDYKAEKIDEVKELAKDFSWIIDMASIEASTKILQTILDSDSKESKGAIVSILSDAPLPKNALPLIAYMLTTEKGRIVFEGNVDTLIHRLNTDEQVSLNAEISKLPAKEDRPQIRAVLFKALINAEGGPATILKIANNPNDMKLSEVGVDNAATLLKKFDLLDIDNTTKLIGAFSQEMSSAQLQELMLATQAVSIEEKGLLTLVVEGSKSTDLKAIFEKTIAENSTVTYGDLYVLDKIIKNQELTSLDAANLLLEEYNKPENKDNALLKAAIEGYYKKYVQLTGKRALVAIDLSKDDDEPDKKTVTQDDKNFIQATETLQKVDPELLAKFFIKAKEAEELAKAQSTGIADVQEKPIVRPENLLLVDFKILATIHDKCHSKGEDKLGEIWQMLYDTIEAIKQFFLGDKELHNFATSLETVMTTQVEFTKAKPEPEQENNIASHHKLRFSKGMLREGQAPESIKTFAGAIAEKATLVKGSIKPEEIMKQKEEQADKKGRS